MKPGGSTLNSIDTITKPIVLFVKGEQYFDGVDPDGTELMTEGTMTITAERKSEHSDENANYIRRERSYGSFTRRFGTEGIDTERMEASFTDGVLTLSMPKLVEPTPVSRRIEIR